MSRELADALKANALLHGLISNRDVEIERLRAALSYYADENYNGHNGGPQCARAALEQSASKTEELNVPRT